MCRPSRIWTSLISQSQPSTCSSISSKESSSGRSARPRSWSILAARISVQICWRIAGSLDGSSAEMLECSSSSCSRREVSPELLGRGLGGGEGGGGGGGGDRLGPVVPPPRVCRD